MGHVAHAYVRACMSECHFKRMCYMHFYRIYVCTYAHKYMYLSTRTQVSNYGTREIVWQ